MNRYDYFKDIYNDFFGVETPKIEVKKNEEDNQIELKDIFNKINDLNVTTESKDLLKKIIEYMRKYSEGIEKNYISFHLILNVNNKTLESELVEILYDSAKYFKYIDNSNKKEISLYKLDACYKYNDGLILFNGLNGLSMEEDRVTREFFYDMEEYLKREDKSILLISGNKMELNNFFLGRESVKNNYFGLEIKGENPDKQDIYNEVISKLELDDSDKINLLDYISETYSSDIDYVSYKNELVKYISFNKELPKLEEKKDIESVFSELNSLVGLSKVKKVLYDLVDLIKLKEKSSDLKIQDVNLHMVFLGNPGTGKTTVARMLANILYDLKYIKENKLIEVSAKDLVAEYVGQTAPKTNAIIEKAMNGILFIDEAYILSSRNNDNSYNAEAIATLIQAMENYRDKLVVIFAGYTHEMQDFLNSNSGIASRIGYTLEFDDYTTDELSEIFLGMTKKAGFIVEEDAIEYLKEIINKYRNMKNFGNARFIRNIYEKTVISHASRVKDKKQKHILKTITKEDINIDNLILE